MNYIVIITKKGIIKKIADSEVRSMSRGAKGVKGISLNEGDEVVAMQVIDGADDQTISY